MTLSRRGGLLAARLGAAAVLFLATASHAAHTVATFAGRAITSAEVSRRIAIAACYPGAALTPGQAAFHLLELAASERMLQRLNLQVSPSLVEAEAVLRQAGSLDRLPEAAKETGLYVGR